MFNNKIGVWGTIAIVWAYIVIVSSVVQAAPCNILVVMSYEAENPWCEEIRDGIDSVLRNRCDVQYVYMDTKKNIESGLEKAKEAYGLYQQLRPDGVIAVDDNAQSMFVTAYLKEKVKTPVIFCAVNEAPSKYGYPATNVTGVLERNFIGQSIAFAKQLIPSIRTIGFLVKESPSGRAILKQVESEYHDYLAEVTEFKLVQTIQKALAEIEVFKKTSDLLFLGATNGILDTEGQPLNNEQVTQIVAKAFGKPMIGANDFHVRNGVLCAVVKSCQAQGKIAAEMLVQTMDGTPVSEIPIRVNKYGKRMLNVTVMESLGIRPRRRALIGTELIKKNE